jgi:hypothetical protein
MIPNDDGKLLEKDLKIGRREIIWLTQVKETSAG